MAVAEPAAETSEKARQSLLRQMDTLGNTVSSGRALLTWAGKRVVAVLPVPEELATAGPAKAISASRLPADFTAAALAAPRKLVSRIIGVGEPVPAEQATSSYRQARLAARAGTVLGGWGPVVAWRDLGIYGQLLQVATDQPRQVALPPPLLDLLGADKQGILTQTAEIFLDTAGDTTQSARLLHIHRSTLQYRLTKIQQACGLDLAKGQDRLTLHLGLKLHRILAGGNASTPTN